MAETIKKYPDHRVGNCQKCSRTFGTIGCCSTVSNEWEYYCEDGQNEWEKHHSKDDKKLNLDAADVRFLCDVLSDAIRSECEGVAANDDSELGYLICLCEVYEKCKYFIDTVDFIDAVGG